MKKHLFLLSALTFLSGCATTVYNGEATMKKDIAACMAATGHSELTAISVPAANNAISHKMAVATLNISGSLAMDALVRLLSNPSRRAVVVIGGNDEMSAATLEMALQKLPKDSQLSKEPVCFAGGRQFESTLRAAAHKAEVNLVLAPNR